MSENKPETEIQKEKKESRWDIPEIVRENELRSEPIPQKKIEELKEWFVKKHRSKLIIVGEDLEV